MPIPKELNLPNALSIFRIIMGPIFFFAILQWDWYTAFIIYLIAEFTDVLDGYLARKYNMVTNFGKFLDGVADKMFMTIILIALAMEFNAPVIYVLLLLTRDIFVSLGIIITFIRFRSINKISKLDFSARTLGKATTAMQVITILMIFFSVPYVVYMVYLVVVLSIICLVDYYMAWHKMLKLD